MNSVDYILLETGLGGRLDATNIVKSPLACVLTRIGIDHQDYLGQTLDEITQEKLGILKKGTPVFSAWQEKPVLDQIISFCREAQLELFYFPKHFGYRSTVDNSYIDYIIPFFSNRKFASNESKNVIRVSKQSLLGEHQKQNTSTALTVYASIVSEAKRLDPGEIERSLQNVSWPGRLDYLDKNRTILLDGAHNESAIECLLSYLKRHHAKERILFAIGWKKDKQFTQMIQTDELLQVEFLPIEMRSKSALPATLVSQILKDNQFVTHPILDVKRLIAKIKEETLPSHDILVVTGSLYLLGEFLAEWQDNQSNYT
jgi:dihydrofolate synthase/folylpolyglutamate synthase